MHISDWSSDVCSSDLQTFELTRERFRGGIASELDVQQAQTSRDQARSDMAELTTLVAQDRNRLNLLVGATVPAELLPTGLSPNGSTIAQLRSEEHTSELQSLMRISYAVLCLKKKIKKNAYHTSTIYASPLTH